MIGEQNSTAEGLAIEVNGLKKSFGNRLALRSIDLNIRQGESVVIFGPNGAGKTTLIKVLATIINPSSGKVIIKGFNLKDSAEKIRSQIGVVTHQTFLYNNLTVYENLEYYSRMYDVPEIKQRISEVASMVEMTSRLHDRAGNLSRGMKQRISIARALLHKPSIMLLDEPETGLDQQVISILWDILQREKEKRTIVLTTHNLERGLKLCDRLIILNTGQIVFQGLTSSIDIMELTEIYQHSTRVGT